MDEVTLGRGRDAGPARHRAARREHRRAHHRRPGFAGDPRRRRARRQPLARQPDRDLAVPAARRDDAAARPSARPAPTTRPTPTCPRTATAATASRTTTSTSTTGSAPNRLAGRAVVTARGRPGAVAVQPRPRPRSGSSDVRVDGRPAKFTHRAGKLRIRPERPIAAGATFTGRGPLRRAPRARPRRWGDIGWDELTDGALVASQPIGAPSWFPCNDQPADKATYRVTVTTAVAVHGGGHRRPGRQRRGSGQHDHLGVRAARADRRPT